MRKLQKKILAVFCASVMLASTFEAVAFAEELAEEPKENIEETVEEEVDSVEEAEPETEELDEEEEVSEEPVEEEVTVPEEPVEEEETVPEEPAEEEIMVPEQPVVEEMVEKKVFIRSEVSDNAKEGDIFRLICELEGYEEGTYKLQWQYIKTDWYGNYIGEWSDLSGENDMELEVVIDEENALRAWRVVVNEI